MLTAGQRIEKVVKWVGLSVHAFAISIGLKRSENLYQIKKGNNGISRNLAMMIVAKYPAISQLWLLTGEGEMLAEQSATNTIPCYTQDLVALIRSGFEVDSSSALSLPIYEGADFAAPYMSDSMDVDIPLGAIVVAQKVEAQDVVFGASYVVATKAFVGVRYIRCGQGEGSLKLVPANTKKYDPMTVEASEIESLYLVRGIIVNKS